MTAVGEFTRLPAGARWLLLASGTSALGSGMVMPLLVVYLSRAHDFSVSLGLNSVAVTSAAALVGGLIGGWASDRLGRVPTLLVAMITAAIGTGSLAFIGAAWQAIVAAAVFGLGIGANASWQALLAESVPDEQRPVAFGSNFGIQNAALGIGAGIAGLVADADRPWTFQGLYLFNGLSFLIAGVMMAVAVRGTHPIMPWRGRRTTEADQAPGGSYLALLRNRQLLLVLTIPLLLFLVGYSQLEAGVPGILVAEIDISTSHISLIIIADTVVAVVAQLLLLSRIKQIRASVCIAVAALTWGGFWALLVVALMIEQPAVRIIVLCVGAGLASVGAAFYSVSVPTLVHAAASQHDRGRANALYGLSLSIGFTLGPALASLFTDHGQALLFVALAFLTTVVIAVLGRWVATAATGASAADRAAESADISIES